MRHGICTYPNRLRERPHIAPTFPFAAHTPEENAQPMSPRDDRLDTRRAAFQTAPADRSSLIRNKIYLLESRLSLQTKYLEKMNLQVESQDGDRDGALAEARDIGRQIHLTRAELSRLEASLRRPEKVDLRRLVYC